MRTIASLFLVSSLLGCESAAPVDNTAPAVFIASQSDFANYTKWEKHDIGMADIAASTGHPAGEELGYRNEDGAHGLYKVGTMLVKEIHVSDVPQQWELFGMVKRGANYNAGGAVDWEYFTLRLNDDLIPIIQTRGSNPADADSSGHGYGQAENGITCNRCHGTAGTEVNDHTLSAALAPL